MTNPLNQYSQDKADLVCEKIMDGCSLRKIEAETGIKRLWVLKWLRENPDFQTQYAGAREEQAEALVEEIIDLADEEPKTTLNKFGAEVVDNGWVSYQKNRVDARKWNAAKLKPKKYGDKQELTIPGIESLSDDKLESKLAQLLGKAGTSGAAGGESEEEA